MPVGRLAAVLVFVFALSAFAAPDVDFPETADQVEAVEVELALPVVERASAPRSPALRWLSRASDSGRAVASSIFRPPI